MANNNDILEFVKTNKVDLNYLMSAISRTGDDDLRFSGDNLIRRHHKDKLECFSFGYRGAIGFLKVKGGYVGFEAVVLDDGYERVYVKELPFDVVCDLITADNKLLVGKVIPENFLNTAKSRQGEIVAKVKLSGKPKPKKNSQAGGLYNDDEFWYYYDDRNFAIYIKKGIYYCYERGNRRVSEYEMGEKEFVNAVEKYTKCETNIPEPEFKQILKRLSAQMTAKEI